MDAGTMSPFEHGEVFVLDDGGEVGRPGFRNMLPFVTKAMAFIGSIDCCPAKRLAGLSFNHAVMV
jgi:hypothetical protein